MGLLIKNLILIQQISHSTMFLQHSLKGSHQKLSVWFKTWGNADRSYVLHTLVCYTHKARGAVESLGIPNYQFCGFFARNLGQTMEPNGLQLGNSFHSPAQFENDSDPRCPPRRRNAAEKLLLYGDQWPGHLWLDFGIRQDLVKIAKFSSSFLPMDTSCEERMRP